MASRTSAINRPNPADLVFLAEGEAKLSIVPDRFAANSINVTFCKEDHTLGALLVNQLLRDKDVSFAAFRMPHPLTPEIVVRVQTVEGTTPYHAVENAFLALNECFAHMRNQLR